MEIGIHILLNSVRACAATARRKASCEFSGCEPGLRAPGRRGFAGANFNISIVSEGDCLNGKYSHEIVILVELINLVSPHARFGGPFPEQVLQGLIEGAI